MDFTAKDIQALRELTGAGMMDCKKALVACEGNQEKAIEFLREKGLAAVAKKSGRIAAEGACHAVIGPDGCCACVVEINSETDFAAKSDRFQSFLKDIAQTVLENKPTDIAALKASKYHGTDRTVEAELQDRVFTIGENIQLRRFAVFSSPVNSAYVHMGGKIAVLVHMEVSDSLKSNPAVLELGREVAMQIAAMRPMWLNEQAADADTVAKERDIYKAQLEQDEKNKNKPPQVLEKIIDGKVKKFLSENCLLEQAFVKENSLTVGQYVAQKAKELGGTVTIAAYERFETGEGLAKREDDFAAEVARMNAK